MNILKHFIEKNYAHLHIPLRMLLGITSQPTTNEYSQHFKAYCDSMLKMVCPICNTTNQECEYCIPFTHEPTH